MDKSTEKELADGWERVFSKTHQQYYWFNTNDGSSSWIDPTGAGTTTTVTSASIASETSGDVSKKRAAVQGGAAEGAAKKAAVADIDSGAPSPYIAIIVC